MSGHSLLKSVTIDGCILLLTCLPKAFHDCSAKFTTGDFECMVCLKKFTLKKKCMEMTLSIAVQLVGGKQIIW